MAILTGYFASAEKHARTKVHIIKDGIPICGSRIGDNMAFQFCAGGIHIEYVECMHCKRIGRRMLQAELDKKLKGKV